MARWAITAIGMLASNLLLVAPIYADVVWHVDDSAVSGLDNGSSWDDAFLDFQSALSVATAGDEIRVAQGLYRPTEPGGSRSISFELRPGVIHQGGYAGFGSKDPNTLDPILFLTILSGDINGDDVLTDFANDLENSFHVVIGDGSVGMNPDTIFRGFTITGGRADASGSTSDETNPDNRGGGMFLLNGASPTIEDCHFVHNRANHFGGGLDAGNGSPIINRCRFGFNQLLRSPIADGAGMRSLGTPVITNSVFEHNRDCCFTGSGGGLSVSNVTIESCTFAHNLSENGSGLFGSNLTLINCDFISNTGTEALSTLQATLIDCRFIANESEYAALLVRPGGSVTAIRCEFAFNLGQIGNAVRNLGTATFINSVFMGNRNVEMAPASSGGAISNAGSLVVINSLFSGNQTKGLGGAIESDGTLALANCTVIGNLAQGFGAVPTGSVHVTAGTAEIRNTILWQNECPVQSNGGEPSQVFVQLGSASLIIDASTVEGWSGGFGGNGNSGLDPLFIDIDGEDDLFGTADDNARLQISSPARDTGENAYLPLDDFDLDLDLATMELISRDLDDLRRVVALGVDRGAYEYQLQCLGDIDPAKSGMEFGNGEVNVFDLLALIGRWGPCPPAPLSCFADINGDDLVNVVDLLLAIGSWGPCGPAPERK